MTKIYAKSDYHNKSSKIVETTMTITFSKNIEIIMKLILDKTTQFKILKFCSTIIASPDFLNSSAFYF